MCTFLQEKRNVKSLTGRLMRYNYRVRGAGTFKPYLSGPLRLSSRALDPVNPSLDTRIAVAHSTINRREEASTKTTPSGPTYL